MIVAALKMIFAALNTCEQRSANCLDPGASDACPNTMLGIRDRALLALGFAGAFRRSELVALRVEDLTECPDGGNNAASSGCAANAGSTAAWARRKQRAS